MPSPFNRDGFPFFNRFLRDETPISTAVAFIAFVALNPLALFFPPFAPGPGGGPPDPDPGMGAMVMCMCMGPCEEAPGRRRGGAMGRNAASLADPLGLCDVPCEADTREPVHRSAGTGVRGPLSTTRAALDEMIGVPSAATPIPPPCAPILRTDSDELRVLEPARDARAVSTRGDGNIVCAAADSSPPQLGTPKPSTAREVHSVSSGEPDSVAGGWGVICEGVPDEDDTDCESVVGEDSVNASPDNGEMNGPLVVPHVKATRT